jgi:hypothetical protein
MKSTYPRGHKIQPLSNDHPPALAIDQNKNRNKSGIKKIQQDGILGIGGHGAQDGDGLVHVSLGGDHGVGDGDAGLLFALPEEGHGLLDHLLGRRLARSRKEAIHILTEQHKVHFGNQKIEYSSDGTPVTEGGGGCLRTWLLLNTINRNASYKRSTLRFLGTEAEGVTPHSCA